MQPEHPDVVIGVDSSTQSTKVLAFDRAGTILAAGSAPIAMTRPGPERYEQDAHDWWESLRLALRTVLGTIDPLRVAAIAIANQRETLVCLDAAGEPVRPALLWLDERAREQLPSLDAAVGGENIHRITGKPLDLTPGVGRIAWLRDNEPQTYRETAAFADVAAYLVNRLTGSLRTSWASADPSGVYAIEERRWSQPILDALQLSADRFPLTFAPGSVLGHVLPAAAVGMGLRAGTPVIAGGGDGQCAGLGTNCVAPGRAYVNLGTAIVAGVWSPTYAWARDWRTLSSATAEGYILELVQRSGGVLINWFTQTFGLAAAGSQALVDLERGASALPIGSDGLLLLPYFSGCMNPHWDPDARGCFVGITYSHGVHHFYRAILEGLTLEIARAAVAMERAGVAIDAFVAIGGGAHSALWVQMLADATNRQVEICETVEASALGAGMLAAFGAGWFASIPAAAEAMRGCTTTVAPHATNAGRYAELMRIHDGIYAANAQTFAELRRFRTSAGTPAQP